jgi:hypothetical protein
MLGHSSTGVARTHVSDQRAKKGDFGRGIVI